MCTKISQFYLWLVLPYFFVFLGYSQTGPGGVGSTDGTSTLKMWYNASSGVVTTGSLVNVITNSAGVSALDLSEAGAQRPTLLPGAVNGFNTIRFSGSNRLETGLTLTTSNFVTNQASSFMVNIAGNTTQRSSVYTTSPLSGASRFSNHIPWAGTVYYDIGNCCGAAARLQVPSLSGLTTSYSFWSYDANPTTGKQLYRNGTLLQSRVGTSSFTNHGSFRFNLGGNTAGTNGFVGDVAEVIIYTTKINTAQRIIIENYLAAKYGLASSSNDLYDEDNSLNGNFDYDVAGIGRIDVSNFHNDAQGTGIVRISNPTNLGDDEFLIWGHDNGTLSTDNTTDVSSSQTRTRLSRVWRISEVSTGGGAVDVGAIDMQIDVTGLTEFNPIYPPQLLVDTDNDGDFNDENPILGAISLGSNRYQFNGVTAFSNNLRFTLGSGFRKVITNRRITYRVKNK
jgi:hypothetical protein